MRLIRNIRPQTLVVMLCLGVVIGSTGTARAQQPSDPNPGNITLTTGIDFPTVYIFRGIVQEADPTFTAQPYGDVGLSFYSGGSGGLKSAGVNFGLWNSLQTGSSGSKGTADKVWYEEDFYATLNLGFGGGTTVGTTYIAYTSPNFMFNTVREVNFKVSSTGNRFAPYGILAFELSGQADAGTNKGTYLELGMAPTLPLATSKATFAIPVKLGLSLNDYYELGGKDNKFGFFDIGVLVTLPLGGIPSGYGSWNVHGGADFVKFGDTTKAFNSGDGSKVVGSVGIGLAY